MRGDAAHAREVDADDVDGLPQKQRLGVVAPALLVAHRDRRPARARAQVGNDLGVARRKDVLEPAEPRLAHLVEERDGVVDRAEDPRGVHPEPRVVARRRARGEQPVAPVVEGQGDRDLEPAPPGSPQLPHLLGHGVGRHRAGRVADDRRRGKPARLAAEVARDRQPGALCEQVVHGEVDDRERPQADAARERGEVRSLAAVERALGVGATRERGADVVRRDRLLDRRRDGPLARQRETEALRAALGTNADERELAVLHHPVAEVDRLGQRGADRRDLELGDRLSCRARFGSDTRARCRGRRPGSA